MLLFHYELFPDLEHNPRIPFLDDVNRLSGFIHPSVW